MACVSESVTYVNGDRSVRGRRERERETDRRQTEIPVSYTHLDVYKRQL